MQLIEVWFLVLWHRVHETLDIFIHRLLLVDNPISAHQPQGIVDTLSLASILGEWKKIEVFCGVSHRRTPLENSSRARYNQQQELPGFTFEEYRP